jgi:putative tryptophan/tyrosine transport system substrate-binding protein
VLAAIAAMPGQDRAMGEQLNAIVKANAPALLPKPWYGMPAYAKENGKIVCFLQSRQIGVNDERRKTLISVLAARGFVETQNLVFEQRYADAHPERLNGLAAELKAANVDVIVTFGYPAALSAKVSADDVPIVVTGAGDPVAMRLVDGMARPGGHLTGVTELSTDLSAKRLEILKDTVPNLQRVAMVWNAADFGMTLRYKSAEDAARVLGVKVQALGVRAPDDFENAFAEMKRERPDAILMVNDALTSLNRKHVVEFADANRLPTIFENGATVRDGGLMSYGPDQSEIGELAADLVARILRGARRRTSRSNHLRASSSSSTLKPRRRSVSNFPPRSALAPIRLSNKPFAQRYWQWTTDSRCPRDVRFSPNRDQIAAPPKCRLNVSGSQPRRPNC